MTFSADTEHPSFPLILRHLGIDTHQQPTVYLRRNSYVCRAEGLTTSSRVQINGGARRLIASLNIIDNEQLLAEGEIGLSLSAARALQLPEGGIVQVCHPQPVRSLSDLRHKVYGHRLSHQQMTGIIRDIVDGLYADVHLASFITACAGDHLSPDEVVSLTRAMLDSGNRLYWNKPVVVDKHCVGGLPGNRTTPIVVSIVTACGGIMPKTSSRAITSPAGTADTMATLTEVELSPDVLQRVVRQEGGCLAWGGSVHLSPADDILIRAERTLGLDSEGQMVASVLSKKIAAGSSHVLIDIPVGPTAKVRSKAAAIELAHLLRHTGKALGLHVEILISDGRQPVGQGIGPALEAADVIRVLTGAADAPKDLRDRALVLAGRLLEMAGISAPETGRALAQKTLQSGRAWEKFQQICQQQGGLKQLPVAHYQYSWCSEQSGRVSAIDNRHLAQLAKLAGAPDDPAAGVSLHCRLGQRIANGDSLLTLHADSPGALQYAISFLQEHLHLIQITPEETPDAPDSV